MPIYVPEGKEQEFKLFQLKFCHIYFMTGERAEGNPISTTIEVEKKYNFEKQQEELIRTITHVYCDFNNPLNESITKRIENIENSEIIIKELSKINLPSLKNNYFTNLPSQKYTHWELSYNNFFKIVGTYDQEIDEIKKIKKLIDVEKICEEETAKVKSI